jgi:hypothetical protein
MDEELVGRSGQADGDAVAPSAAPLSADWNTSLSAPPARSEERPAGAGSHEAPNAERHRPRWQDPADLPSVQSTRTGAFGDTLQAIDEARKLLIAALSSVDTVGLTDPEAVALLQAVEAAGRPVDAARVTTAAVVGDRSRRGLGRDSLAWRMGAASSSELLTRLTTMSAAEMNRRVKLGERVTPRSMSGSRMEPDFPVVAAALAAGELSLDSAAQIVGALADFTRHGRFDADPAQVDAAEAALVESATGSVFGRRSEGEHGELGEREDDATRDGGPADGVDGPICRLGDSDGFTFPADLIRGMGQEWRAVLNPDGAAPNDATSEAKSTFGFGTLKDGLYPLRGGFTPELKGIVSNVFNTYLSARSGPSFPSAEDQARIDAGELVPGDALDERTGGHKRADILRGIFTRVAQDPATPTMGGMPPTVMVHVNARDLLTKNGVDLTGVGWIDGVDAPISMRTITQMIDNGGMQPVFIGANGAVLGLGSKARCFTPLQRKAITARDGGCIIDGCDCPPQWTEIHHVVPWEHGGKTEITNGVLLCWYHHHSLGTSGWQIRMRRGMPEVKGPPWLDPAQKWRVPRRHRASAAA